MTKKELVEKLAEQTGYKKACVNEILDSFCDTVADELKAGEKVQLFGFGTFEARQSKARTIANPRNGVIMDLPSVKTPVFRAGTGLKEKLRS